MSYDWETLWAFDTPNFRVALEVAPEDTHPSELCEFDEDFEFALEGGSHWFVASVAVYYGDDEDDLMEIGRDVLGGCSYRSFEEFYTAHRDPDPMNRNCSIMRASRGENVSICHYFPDMVRKAIRDARRNCRRLGASLKHD